MACQMCSRNSHCHPSFNGIPNCDINHYSDVPIVPDDVENEPEAPMLSLGNRILWLTESRAASGIVRWIGRMPAISDSWSAGIEFDNVMPEGGNGDFRGRQYFQSRLGHAVFLPVSDLLKVDSGSSGNAAPERTSFFGRLQDSCSNFAHRRRRDSTFGHFKQDYCSNCNQNDFGNYSHYCHRTPVYDRITTRRSLCYDDHPYEMYNACMPCNVAPNHSSHFHQEDVSPRERVGNRRSPCIIEEPRLTILRPANNADVTAHVNNNEYQDHPNNFFPRFNSLRRESFFNPRPSINLINGFKEWVTCFILGTNRKKRKSKFVFKDKKSVTSVFIAQNGQSLTGQRLSSFADYASVTVNRASNHNPVSIDNNVEDKNTIAVEKHTSEPKIKYKKKRPAPLPPIQYSRNSDGNNKNNEGNIVTKKDSKSTATITESEVGKTKETRFKIVRSSSIRIHSQPRRQKPKKRRAPPPPVVYSSIEKSNMVNANINSIPGPSTGNVYEKKDEKVRYRKNSSGVSKMERNLKSKKGRQKFLYQHVRKGNFIDGYSDSGQESGSEASKDSSNSISFSENESDDEKYGLVKYGIINKISSSDNGHNLPTTSNFVQYAGDNSDVCLKISIQKTETNVVTVEEVSTPCSTTHYTIEEDTSSSEISDAPIMKDVEQKAITYQEPKLNSTDSSSVSTVEDPTDKSKTIFEELQMQPPAKGSVKDFVNAFNMLATKSTSSVPERKASTSNLPPKIEINSAEMVDSKNKPKDNQSMPTKWEYQTKAANVIYASNNFLLPIAEESHNDTSEHDGNVSTEDPKNSPSTKAKNCNGNSVGSKTSEINDNSSKKCSHCSETHIQPVNHNGVPSKSLKKRAAPRKERKLYESVRPLKSNISSQASMAALSSLLHEKMPGDSKESKHGNFAVSSKNNSKLDQPIMVGLYIEDKSSHRGPIPLLVTPSMSLKKLKKQIEKEYEFPKHQQCWILGESFAVADEVSLASYGVTEPGCPILLYVMAKDSKSHSLPARSCQRIRANPQQDCSDSSEEETDPKHKGHKKNSSKTKQDFLLGIKDLKKETHLLGAIPKTDKSHPVLPKAPPSRKRTDSKQRKGKSEFHQKWEKEFEKKADYHTLLELDDVDLVTNVEQFECPICFLDVNVGEGATLQECLHSFCKECLAGAIQFAETAVVKCPFRNDEYSCECHLQEREVKSLVTTDIYERHLQRSMALAESQAQDSFHCKTPDCPGWCLFEDNVNTFLCPVCKHTNCLTCTAIHEGKNCRQYQDDVAFRCDSSEEARKTKEYLQTIKLPDYYHYIRKELLEKHDYGVIDLIVKNLGKLRNIFTDRNMVDNGEAMRCPQCHVIMMKKWGCDWLKCSMCHTEVCWVTKGPRWGPGGRGDTSGGCKCMINGVRCHPKCSYCH